MNCWTVIMFYKQLNASQVTAINNVHNKLAEELTVWHVNTSHDWLSRHMTKNADCLCCYGNRKLVSCTILAPACWILRVSVLEDSRSDVSTENTTWGCPTFFTRQKWPNGMVYKRKGTYIVIVRCKVWLIREIVYSNFIFKREVLKLCSMNAVLLSLP